MSRLVQLMQKFSKKLVSKVIYVRILQASSSDLLEHFLREKGWALLNTWFDDAIRSLNWPLCAELSQLFTQCPMTAARLKENVETNLAPKLIRQLSCDPRVEPVVRKTASQVTHIGKPIFTTKLCCKKHQNFIYFSNFNDLLQVLTKWMAVVSDKSPSPAPLCFFPMLQ